MMEELDINERIRRINKVIVNSKQKDRLTREALSEYQLYCRKDQGDRCKDCSIKDKIKCFNAR